MKSKKITHKDEMGEKIATGIHEIASIVKRTLGPGGLPILIDREGTAPNGDPLGPMITKDGVTVASECSSPDPEVDLVIQTVKAICKKTNRIAGDGTTTAIVLGESILTESLDALKEDKSLNPQLVRESVEAASKQVRELLQKIATPCRDSKMVEDVATISANGDAEIGRVIREAFDAVGAEGVITVDEGYGPQTTIDVVQGFQIRRGAEAQDRFFNNIEGTRFECEQPAVILYDGKIMSYTEILPVLNTIAGAAAKDGKKGLPPIVLIAHEFSPEVIQFLLIQRNEVALRVCAVKAPHTTTVRTEMLDDMAVMLGCKRLGNGNESLERATLDHVGSCERVIVDKYTTTFYDGDGSEESVIERVEQLKARRKVAESPYDASLISDRIASLSQGIAKIGVGGTTDLEIKERYHRIEDALNAARAAVEEGIIPGGGVVLARIAHSLQPGDTIGERILSRALLAPFNQIVENISGDPTKILSSETWPDSIDSPLTYDARNKKIVNALEAGIIDPVKVTRTALENATSIAALLSTCGGSIVLLRKQE